MRRKLLTLIRSWVRKTGFDIIKYSPTPPPLVYPQDFEKNDIQIIETVQPFTYTSPERIYSLRAAVKYIVENQIPGDIVECGVWKGGSIMAAILTLLELGDTSRHLYLFDTFEGMTQPNQKDISIGNRVALDIFQKKMKQGEKWVYASLEEVQNAVLSLGYANEKIHFIKGKVEDTLPTKAPKTISLLRLDTDWYESTQHELNHLFPHLSRGGVIIIDDYGEWKGAKEATDNYIKNGKIPLFLNRIDYTGRLGIKI
jgi:O-methyltransferase